MRTTSISLITAFVLSACTTTTAPVPDPPAEARDWVRSDDAAGPGAYLGLATRENDSGRLDDLFFEPGVRVARVDPNSPADVAGIAVGDVVLAWDGTELLEPESLDALERGASGGDVVELQVRRGDTVFAVPVALRARVGAGAGDVEVLARVDPVRSRARWRTVAGGGARLMATAENGPFARAGVPPGARVHAVDGRATASARELIRVLLAQDAGSKVEIAWTDVDGNERTSTVRLADVPRVVTGFSVPILTTYTHDPDADRTDFVLLDLWIISLLRYAREGEEREWRFLRWFSTSTGVGELGT